ncbi:MAG: ester cyclase [Gemmataceae bacterium]|nr:ester cyclase [Gemmataceae bacterium]
MSIIENKTLVERYYEQVWNRWDLAAADDIIAATITLRGSLGVTVRGLDGFKGYVRLVRTAFPDFHNAIEELIAEQDKVVARLEYRGTHQGKLFHIAPTGKLIRYAGMALFRIADHKIVDGWVLGDTLSLMQQIGVFPQIPVNA